LQTAKSLHSKWQCHIKNGLLQATRFLILSSFIKHAYQSVSIPFNKSGAKKYTPNKENPKQMILIRLQKDNFN